MSSKFINAHIGGRGGSMPFPRDTFFNDSIDHILFEADKDCIEQIKQRNPIARVFPYCISNKNMKGNFNIHMSGFASSILPFNANYGEFISCRDNSDAYMKHVNKKIRTEKTDFYSLDYLVEKNLLPPINFLSVDTQGSEYLVLEGAQMNLKENIVAIQLEVNFVHLYQGGKLFADIDALLNKNGFFLADLRSMNSLYSERIPSIFRGKQIPFEGEALYFLNPEAIKVENKKYFVEKIEKLAFALIVYGYIDIAFKALKILESKGLRINDGLSYQRFLTQFYNKINECKTKLPELWHERFSFEDINKKFKADEIDTNYFKKSFIEKVFYRLKKNPFSFLKIVFRFALDKLISIFKTKQNSDRVSKFTIKFKINTYTSFGNFLLKYKLFKAAKEFIK
mgnify:CR=1 FL=1|tara:strand:- start:5125 stop:6312 length:1188 start_codon:yes stop_codon:yes gene_type:complete